MSPDTIVVTGLGMVSSLGLDVTTGCAAARAGLSRARVLTALEVADAVAREMVPVKGHAAESLTGGFTGLGRLIRLGTAALADLMSYSVLPNDGRTGIVVNASSGYYLTAREKEEHAALDKLAGERRGTQDLYEMQLRNEHYAKHLIARVSRFSGLSLEPQASRLLFQDQTAMSDAFKIAVGWLKQRTVERCVIGGVDSYLETYFVSAFNHFSVLKTEARPVGFLPGEAAAFLLLERLDVARRRGARIEALLHAPQKDAEPMDRLSGPTASGAALARTIERALTALPDRGQRLGLTIAGLNGDDNRSSDWGSALVRLREAYPELGQYTWYPAESFGETGAAAGPVAACVGVRGLVRGYANTNEILVWLSSDTGVREAFCLSRYEG